MSCPRCGKGMYLNGNYWQCPSCGYLKPRNGYAPFGAVLLPMI